MEKRIISSGTTLFWKKAYPVLWITFSTLGAAGLLWRMPQAPVLAVIWIAAATAGAAYVLWFASRIKVVSIDSHFLYFHDGGREVAVPLGQITGVRESMLGQPKQVTVELNESVWPARQIVFLPLKAHGIHALVTDPIVDDLRQHIAVEPRRRRDRRHLGHQHGRRP